MRELTQTNLDPGNCWQTCVACLLDVDPESLPAQVDYDKFRLREDGTKEWFGLSYGTVLNAYLREHHGLGYVQLYYPQELWSAISVRDPGWHLMTGRTVRSATNGGVRHVVVARYGEVAWDPHPSRAGLLDEMQWAFLLPHPESWRSAKLNDQPCECPACVATRNIITGETP